MIGLLMRALVVCLPWPVRRLILNGLWNYEIHPTARIGLSWVYPKKLRMGEGARIGHFTVCKGLDLVAMGDHSIMGNGNWITGLASGHAVHFIHRKDRKPELHLGEHAAVTSRHLLDCTDCISIGRYTTFAGFRSQVVTHWIDVRENRQTCAPVAIGDYCFVGTGCTLIAGSALPHRSVLGAHSLLNKAHEKVEMLYGGVPAVELKELDGSWPYFRREKGYVD